MGSFISDLKNGFNRGNISLQLIYINVGVFVVTTLVSVFLMLFNYGGYAWLQCLELPAGPCCRFSIGTSQHGSNRPWNLRVHHTPSR